MPKCVLSNFISHRCFKVHIEKIVKVSVKHRKRDTFITAQTLWVRYRLNSGFVREITLVLQMLGEDVSLKGGFQSDRNHNKIDNFLEMADANDFLHCSINPMAARTGRMSISDPSMQNLSRDDKVVRGSFVPGEGNVYITCDADQIEGRMGAHVSQDEALIQAFLDADQPGAPDFFSVVARDLYRDPSITKADPRRQLTKTYFYAKQYGSGLERLARTSGVPFEQVKETDALFTQRYHRLTGHMGEIMRMAAQQKADGLRPFVKTLMGRTLPGDVGKEYALMNYEVQGSAAEVLKLGMIHLDAVGLLDYMLLPIHDEILFEVPAAQAEEVLRLVERTLTNRTDYRVPITWSGDIMTERWKKT